MRIPVDETGQTQDTMSNAIMLNHYSYVKINILNMFNDIKWINTWKRKHKVKYTIEISM